ncbi:arginyltransferase [candidate division KSB3 bacterium]|uniref:Aspartate/glutamate leucyltransferase n=1 Tax=candidate division KSB3 bacterium TaxID=2044937 RepID=A0A2G6KB40_9BACT|nr:MAG: arginyltransferase [candidate division KSB3 bacterium]
MEQRFLLYQHDNGSCPYLADREWTSHAFYADTLNPLLYEQLMSKGFRRSGTIFYQNHCHGCTACKPIKVNIHHFSPSISQRRVLRKNRDVTMTREPASFEMDDFLFYRNYIEQRHPSSSLPSPESYVNFLIVSPVSTEIMRYYIGKHMVGLAWIDLLPHSLSSVYFAFDPAYSSRSLGTYSILRQISLAQELQKKWLQLGFWVEESRKMSYKSRFKPCYILNEGRWKQLV